MSYLPFRFCEEIRHGRVAQPDLQLALDAPICKSARFIHERVHHWRYGTLHLGTRQAWGMRQAIAICHCIKILSHFHLTVIACVINTARFSALQRRHRNTRQIIGMNVIGITVLCIHDARLLQTVQRQTLSSVNTRHAQDADIHPAAYRPVTDLPFGIHPKLAARRLRVLRMRLAHPPPAAIAIHAAGADINQTSGFRPPSTRLRTGPSTLLRTGLR